MRPLILCVSIAAALGLAAGACSRTPTPAAETATQHRLALADAAIYSMAQEHDATLWTQDVDYEGLPGVHYRAKP